MHSIYRQRRRQVPVTPELQERWSPEVNWVHPQEEVKGGLLGGKKLNTFKKEEAGKSRVSPWHG